MTEEARTTIILSVLLLASLGGCLGPAQQPSPTLPLPPDAATADFRFTEAVGGGSMTLLLFEAVDVAPAVDIHVDLTLTWTAPGGRAFVSAPWVVPSDRDLPHRGTFHFLDLSEHSSTWTWQEALTVQYHGGASMVAVAVAADQDVRLEGSFHGLNGTAWSQRPPQRGTASFHQGEEGTGDVAGRLQYDAPPTSLQLVHVRSHAPLADAAYLRATLPSGASWEGPSWAAAGSRNGVQAVLVGGYAADPGRTDVSAGSATARLDLQAVSLECDCLAFVGPRMEV